VICIPGACSVIVALCQSGLPSDKFFFGGFPPAKKNQRINFFNDLLSVPSTLIFFESPKRILNTLEDLGNIFGNSQQIVVCRELTKNFEENKRGTIDSIIKILRKENNLRGEFTVVVNRKENIKPDLNLIKSDLIYLLKKNTFRDSVAIVSKKYSLSKKEVYNLGLKILNN
jgi:16S rRNA (cytidine1402-2'-O)-methyltransferase